MKINFKPKEARRLVLQTMLFVGLPLNNINASSEAKTAYEGNNFSYNIDESSKINANHILSYYNFKNLSKNVSDGIPAIKNEQNNILISDSTITNIVSFGNELIIQNITYDKNGNEIKKTYRDNDNNVWNIEFNYDNKGRCVEKICKDKDEKITSSILYKFDENDKLAEEIYSNFHGATKKIIYTANNNIQEIINTSSNGKKNTIKYIYQNDRLIQEIDDSHNGNIINYEYNDNGQLIKKTKLNSDKKTVTETEYLYNNDKLYKEVEYSLDLNMIVTIFYNDNGTIKKKLSYPNKNDVTSLDTIVTTYIYEDGKLVKEESLQYMGGRKHSKIYEYDSNGNKKTYIDNFEETTKVVKYGLLDVLPFECTTTANYVYDKNGACLKTILIGNDNTAFTSLYDLNGCLLQTKISTNK